MTIFTKTGEPLLYENESYILRGIWMDIYNDIGPGHKESVYVKAFIQELQTRNIQFQHEKTLNLIRRGLNIGQYRPDFIIWDKIIVEVKALEFVPRVHLKKIQSYLKSSDFRLAFLVNFGASQIQIFRQIHNKTKNYNAHNIPTI